MHVCGLLHAHASLAVSGAQDLAVDSAQPMPLEDAKVVARVVEPADASDAHADVVPVAHAPCYHASTYYYYYYYYYHHHYYYYLLLQLRCRTQGSWRQPLQSVRSRPARRGSEP